MDTFMMQCPVLVSRFRRDVADAATMAGQNAEEARCRRSYRPSVLLRSLTNRNPFRNRHPYQKCVPTT